VQGNPIRGGRNDLQKTGKSKKKGDCTGKNENQLKLKNEKVRCQDGGSRRGNQKTFRSSRHTRGEGKARSSVKEFGKNANISRRLGKRKTKQRNRKEEKELLSGKKAGTPKTANSSNRKNGE